MSNMKFYPIANKQTHLEIDPMTNDATLNGEPVTVVFFHAVDNMPTHLPDCYVSGYFVRIDVQPVQFYLIGLNPK